MNKQVEYYWNEDHSAAAVLVSPRFGAGWSTWNYPVLAYDKRVIEYWLDHKNENSDNVYKFMESIGYTNVYCGGWRDMKLEWVPKGVKWRIDEYDGSEGIVYYEGEEWNCFE